MISNVYTSNESRNLYYQVSYGTDAKVEADLFSLFYQFIVIVALFW